VGIKTASLSFRAALGAVALGVSGIVGFIDWAARAEFVENHINWLRSVAMIAAPWIPYPSVLWLPILLLGLGLIWWDARRRDRASNFRIHTAKYEGAGETDLHARIADWLAKSLAEPALYINQAFLFGSIVHDTYKTSDVDLIIEFKSVGDRQLAARVKKIKGRIAHEFELTFPHKLHVTFFCSNERAQCEQFLAKAGKFEIIKGNS
jgi:predicted nucleotidyltransferase